jgi:hypothetical protein
MPAYVGGREEDYAVKDQQQKKEREIWKGKYNGEEGTGVQEK